MHLKQWIGASVALLVMPMAATASADVDGKKLYEANCAQCHGMDGTVSKFGASLKPPARDHRALAALVDREELRRIITNGIQGTEMTPKKYNLQPLEIEAVIDYIKSFTYTPDLANGKQRFEAVCSTCHGTDGRAKTGFGAKNLVHTQLDLKGIAHTMRYGRPGTKMTSKRPQMTNRDIADVANYVYSLRYQADAERGGKLYAKSCAKCHATPAKIKLIGNAAHHTTFSDLDDLQLDLRIRHGRHIDRAGEQITKLSGDDLQDIMLYMRNNAK